MIQVWNNSSFVQAQECWRMWYLAQIKRYGLKYEQSLPSFLPRFEGTLWHAVLAEHYSKDCHFGVGVSGVINSAYEESIEKAPFEEEANLLQERKQYFFDLYEAYEKHWREDFDRWDIKGVEEQLISTLRDTCPTCKQAFSPELVRGVETPRVHDCGTPIIYVVAQIDLRVEEDGVPLIVDHKTKKTSVSDWYLESFNESPQFTQYLFIARRVLGDLNLNVGVANVTAKLKNIDKKGKPFHRNSEIVRTQTDYQQWQQDRLAIAMAADIKTESSTPPGSLVMRNPSSCRRFGLCEYYGMCWPSRDDWDDPPYDLMDTYEVKSEIHIDNYAILLSEEVS